MSKRNLFRNLKNKESSKKISPRKLDLTTVETEINLSEKLKID